MALPLDNAEIVRRVLVAFPNAEKVILFGSRAAGTARLDSDIDLLVVAETDLRPAWRSGRIAQALRDLGLPTDILVYTAAEYAQRRSKCGGIVQIADNTGKVLHAA